MGGATPNLLMENHETVEALVSHCWTPPLVASLLRPGAERHTLRLLNTVVLTGQRLRHGLVTRAPEVYLRVSAGPGPWGGDAAGGLSAIMNDIGGVLANMHSLDDWQGDPDQV